MSRTRSTDPCRTVVRPVPSESAQIKRDNMSSTVDFRSSPKVSVHPLIRATAATAGIVKPILASAEPNAKFKLVCKRLARAAR